MEENLFFRATASIIQKRKFNSIFLQLILLPLLCFSSLFNASVLENSIPQQNEQAIIYISGNAAIIGTEAITNAEIVEVDIPLDRSVAMEVAPARAIKRVAVSKTEPVNHIKDLPKFPKPRFVFKSTKSDESFDAASFSNTKNSVITLAFFSKNIVAYSYIAVNVHVFTYLMSIYTVDFSKTAALSQFLFSRPPPFC